MGWATCGKDDLGRDIGYAIEAICDLPSCDEKIDRGLYYCCGDMHGGGEYGCGRYFCGEHIYFGGPESLCAACLEEWEKNSDNCPACEGKGGRCPELCTYGFNDVDTICDDCGKRHECDDDCD